MKKAGILNITITVLMVLSVFSLPGWAEWTEPVLMDELNDQVNMKLAHSPTLLPDLSEMYFIRDYQLIQAKIDPATGLYTNQRYVTELNRNQGIRSCWLSTDGLKLYYAERVNGATRHVIQMATRSSLNSAWSFVKTLNEIHVNTFDFSPSLSADELTIIWITGPNPGTPITTRKAYMAKRNSKTAVSVQADFVKQPDVFINDGTGTPFK
jgi:hypothetical protein